MFERKFCNVCDKQNMIKFLNKQKRVYEKMFDSIKTVIIPIYIVLYSIGIAAMDKISAEMEATEEAKIFCMIFMTLFIVSISSYCIFLFKSDIYFYEDYIDCLDNE